MARWTAIGFAACCLTAVMIGISIRNRTNDLLGKWQWGARIVYFDDEGGFHSPGPWTGPLQSLDGGWEWSRGKVHFWNTVIDGPNPGWTFELSKNGRILTAVSGLNADDAFQMTKLSTRFVRSP